LDGAPDCAASTSSPICKSSASSAAAGGKRYREARLSYACGHTRGVLCREKPFLRRFWGSSDTWPINLARSDISSN
jgi:hypothetical protein